MLTTLQKKMNMKMMAGMMMFSSLVGASALANERQETKEGFIPQMMDQVNKNGFALTNNKSAAVLEIRGAQLSSGAKILLTLHFGT